MTVDAEPVVAVASTPREWGQALHRHLVDHGGARLRATVLHPDDALAEDYDVLVADDGTSFLTHRLVAELSRRGRTVLGVFDPDDPHGKDRLRDLGVGDVVERDAEPAEILARVAALVTGGAVDRTATAAPLPPAPPRRAGRQGRVVVVAGAAGGTGASETAVTLADLAGASGRVAALVDADDTRPNLAQRLGCGLYPNVVAAVDAHARGRGQLRELALDACGGRVALLAGSSRDHAEVSGEQLGEVVDALATSFGVALVDVAATTAAPAGGWRHDGSARALIGRAEAVVVVADASPCGAARALSWLAAVDGLAEPGRVHVAWNRSDVAPFRRGELDAEVARVAPLAGTWHLPADARVTRAAWDGVPAPPGPYRRAVAALLTGLAPEVAGPRRRTWSFGRRHARATS